MADISKLNVNNTDYNIKDATARSGKTDKSDLTAISITGTKNDTGSVIPINKFFYLNGELVIAKTDIADNATLTENTNYIKITAGILNGLYNVLQDVTPTSSDKILIIQSQGQGLAPHTIKMDSANPTGTGKLSLNRKANTTEGNQSVAVGYNNEASGVRSFSEGANNISSGNYSHSEGYQNTASSDMAHAEGNGTTASGTYSHAEGSGTTASGNKSSHAEGYGTTASGDSSHAEGNQTIANHLGQHVFGAYNVADASTAASSARGNYVEIVGNGTGTSARSNARTLDWSGNEVLAGDLTINGNVSVGGAIDTLKNLGLFVPQTTGPVNIYCDGNYRVLILMGMFQKIGGLLLAVEIYNGAVDLVKNLLTGDNFSNSHLTFSFANKTLTITAENSSYFDVIGPNITRV